MLAIVTQSARFPQVWSVQHPSLTSADVSIFVGPDAQRKAYALAAKLDFYTPMSEDEMHAFTQLDESGL